LQNDQQHLVTPRWRHKAWIECELQFEGMHRPLMEPKRRMRAVDNLPDCTIFEIGSQSYLKHGDVALPGSHAGYLGAV